MRRNLFPDSSPSIKTCGDYRYNKFIKEIINFCNTYDYFAIPYAVKIPLSKEI